MIQHIYSKEASCVTFRLPPLTALSETGRTLAAFQGSDTLGSVSNVSHDYSNSADKQGHEGKTTTKQASMESRHTRAPSR